MKYLICLMLMTVSFASQANNKKLSEEEVAFEKRFNELSELGVALNNHPAIDGPWGLPNPDAPKELNQFSFMVGRHDCKMPMQGINPSSPNQSFKGKLLWLAYYALDGRAIRDEFYGMTNNGEQTRVYDPYAKEWWVTFATVPGAVSLVPEPKPRRGSFTALQNNKGDMVMTSELTDKDDTSFVRTITFFEITESGFEWKSENVYPDKIVKNSSMSCKKVAGPD